MVQKVKIRFQEFKDFLSEIDLKLTIFVLPIFLGFCGALFEGSSFALLIPTVKGIIEGNTHFVKDMPYLKTFFSILPLEFKDRSIKIFAILVLLTFISVVLKNLFSYLTSISSSFQVWHFSNNLRKRIFEKYLSFGKLYFDQNNIGRLHELLTGYTRQISLQLRDANSTIFMLLTLIVYLFIMVKISWKLTLLIFIISPVFYFSLNTLVHKIKLSSESYIINYNSLLKNLSNSLLCIPLIKSYSCEEFEKEKFNKDSDRVESNEFSIDKKRELISPLSEIMVMCLIIVLIGIMAFLLYIKKEGEVSSFMVFFLLLRRSMGAFSAVSRFQSILNAISGPISEIKTIFNDENKFFVKSGDKEFKGLKDKIELKDLSFSFPGKTSVLKRVNLSIEKNKVTAIVGPSGAGKSTIINLLLRFYDYKDGEILLDNKSIKDFSLKSYLSKIAYISQEAYLFNDTLKNNLIYGLGERSEKDILEAIKKANLESLLNKLPDGLNTQIGDRGVKLSGGEKQKVSIARTILKNAEILIMDEATSSLDSVSEREIQSALHEASKERTTIVIAHRLSTIKNADKIIVISDGTVKEEGNLNELISKKSLFYELWEEQKFY